MTRLKISLVAILLILSTAMIIWLAKPMLHSSVQTPLNTTNKKISVVATIYPLGFLAEYVGGNKVVVEVITPPGAEPHDFEPSPYDIVKTRNANIFIINGKGMDVWAERTSQSLRDAGIKILRLSDYASPSEDPHIWLDMDVMQKAAEAMAVLFGEIDPINKEEYTANAELLKQEFVLLDDEYKRALKDCKIHAIVVSHDAFGYLTDRYGIQSISIAGLSTEEEPSAKHLSEITKLVREKGIKYIFFETLVSPKLSKLIADETNAGIMVLNPIGGLTSEEIQQGKNYFSVMNENLTNLRQAMLCR